MNRIRSSMPGTFPAFFAAAETRDRESSIPVKIAVHNGFTNVKLVVNFQPFVVRPFR